MSRTWIFQASPDRFDIDGFLASRPLETSWLVTRYASEIRVDDDVYIWRAGGKDGASKSGIVAKARVIGGVARHADDPESRHFWKEGQDENAVADRTRIEFSRIANKNQIIQRSWVQEDPILRDLLILKLANGTNYAVDPLHASRLDILWEKAGTPWSYADTVAGLWAFLHTEGREVSKLPGSPVPEAAIQIGRSVGSLYNKVMNFRALDPRDERKGLDGTTDMDERVWAKFYDASSSTLRANEVDAEMARLWGEKTEETPADEAAAIETAVEEDARKWFSLDLAHLLANYRKGRLTKPRKPPVKRSKTRTFKRDPLVIAIAKVRAQFRCEVPGCSHPTFIDEDGLVFCEVHHIEPLADGGDDTPENVACICPAHHREAHHGKHAAKIKSELEVIRRNERAIADSAGVSSK